MDDARIEAVVTATLESGPPDATHWSSRGMAAASGLSVSAVQRVWRAFGLQPHRLETFKLSTDPDFVAKVRDVEPRGIAHTARWRSPPDVVGLFMAPPDRALVLCVEPRGSPDVDEKSQSRRSTAAEPLRVSRRLFGLGYAARACPSTWA